MEKSMFGIQPANLSDEELVRYAWLSQGILPPEWVKELVLRLEQKLDDNK